MAVHPWLSVYLITNKITGQQYVGIVRNRTVAARWSGHVSAAKAGKGYALADAIRLHGRAAFEVVHVACALDRDALNQIEMALIADYGTFWPDGYNRTRGGTATFRITNPITVDGTTYCSFNEMAVAHGLTYSMVRGRYFDSGWTLRQALNLEPPPQWYLDKITVAGIEYPSMQIACETLGIFAWKVRDRRAKGWTIEEAFGIVKKEFNHSQYRPVTIRGRAFRSMTKAAEHYGVEPWVLSNRIRQGWTPEQAVGLDPAPSYLVPITVGGIEYPSIAAARLAYPKVRNVRQRLAKGWTPDETFELVKRIIVKNLPRGADNKRSIPITVNDHGTIREFVSVTDAAKHYGLTQAKVSRRLSRCWTEEQAVGIEPPPKRVNTLASRMAAE